MLLCSVCTWFLISKAQASIRPDRYIRLDRWTHSAVINGGPEFRESRRERETRGSHYSKFGGQQANFLHPAARPFLALSSHSICHFFRIHLKPKSNKRAKITKKGLNWMQSTWIMCKTVHKNAFSEPYFMLEILDQVWTVVNKKCPPDAR